MNGHWQENLQQIYPLTQTPEQHLDKQLALCGVSPEEIKTVVLSHMHLDHAGNLQLFPHAYDNIAFIKSVEKVRKLEKQHNAKIIFVHDHAFFQTFKMCPCILRIVPLASPSDHPDGIDTWQHIHNIGAVFSARKYGAL